MALIYTNLYGNESTSFGDVSVRITGYNDSTVTKLSIPAYIINKNVLYAVTQIDSEAFYGYTNITNVTFPKTIQKIYDYAFYKCTSLKSVDLSESDLTAIYEQAFCGCTSLASVNIENCKNSIAISDYAFYGAPVSTLKIYGSSITVSNGNQSFNSSIKYITVSGDISALVKSNGVKMFWGVEKINSDNYYEYNNSLLLVAKPLTEFTIPSNITSVGAYAFYYCTSLTSITIPDSVTSISDWAFHSCKSLTSVDLSNCTNLTTILSRAFASCTSLASINIPESVTSIYGYTFSGCTSLTSVDMSNATNLKNLSYDNVADYVATFADCTSLESIDFSNTIITSLGPRIFRDCTSLKSVHIPATCTNIGYGSTYLEAFYLCTQDDLVITIDAEEDSISGSPWGATNATIVWGGVTDDEESSNSSGSTTGEVSAEAVIVPDGNVIEEQEIIVP